MQKIEFVKANDIDQDDEIYDYSDPHKAQENATNSYGKDGQLYRSTRKDKKYMIIDPQTNKFVHFGAIGYEDATKHNDLNRVKRYLKRAENIKGGWKNDEYSPNNLSIRILWSL
jgi:hypothetical protein